MSFRNLFSERLGKLRKERGMSYAELGKQLGVSDEAVRLMEKAKRSPSFEILCSIAELFAVPVDYLLGRGVFENWDKVLQHKELVCKTLSEQYPVIDQIGMDLMALSDSALMQIIAALVRKIEFVEEEGQCKIKIFLYPMYLPD